MPTWMPGVNGQVVLMATDTGVLRRLWALIWLPAALSAHAPGSRYSCTGYPCMTDMPALSGLRVRLISRTVPGQRKDYARAADHGA